MQVEADRAFQVSLALNTRKVFTHQKENTKKQTQIAPGYESDQVLNIVRLPFPFSRRFSSFSAHEQKCIYVICRLGGPYSKKLSRLRSQFFTIRTDPKPVNNLFIYFFCPKNCLNFCKKQGQNLTKALQWPVGRYRKILPAITTNQNAGFVTVPSEKKIIICMFNLL